MPEPTGVRPVFAVSVLGDRVLSAVRRNPATTGPESNGVGQEDLQVRREGGGAQGSRGAPSTEGTGGAARRCETSRLGDSQAQDFEERV